MDFLTHNPARVVMMDLDDTKGPAIQKELDETGKRCIFVKSNVTSASDVSHATESSSSKWEAVRERVQKEWGGIDIVVNCGESNVTFGGDVDGQPDGRTRTNRL